MVLNILRGLFSEERKQYRHVAEQLKDELPKSNNICFGRYDAADDVLKALYREGMLEGKNIYTASRRTSILAKRLGLESRSPRYLRKKSDRDFIYVENQEELERIVSIIDEMGREPSEFERCLVCSYTKGLPEVAEELGFRNVIEKSDAIAKTDYIFIDSVDQIERHKYSMLVGGDMKKWFTLNRYSLKDLKELLYGATSIVALSEAPIADYLGEDGKRFLVEYTPGRETETLDFLKNDVRMIADDVTMNDVEVLYGKELITRKRQKLVTANAKNVMALPFDSRIITDRGEILTQYEVEAERFPAIGERRTSLVSMTRPNVALFLLPDGTFDRGYSHHS
jgi:hypothetical protein